MQINILENNQARIKKKWGIMKENIKKGENEGQSKKVGAGGIK